MKIKLSRNLRLEISNEALRHPIDAMRNRLNEPAVQLTRRNRNAQAAQPPRPQTTLPQIPVTLPGTFQSAVQDTVDYEQALARSEVAARENTRASKLSEAQRMLRKLPKVEEMLDPTPTCVLTPRLPPAYRPEPPKRAPKGHGPGFFDGTFNVPGVTANGVQTLDAEQLAAAATRLQTIMTAEWLRPSETVANMSEADWNAKIRDTDRALNRLASGLPDHKVALGCVFDGEPIGLAMCEPLEDELWIDYVVAHPLQAGAGSALIEAAVNLAWEKDFGGVVSLEPWPGSKQAFLAMGFEDTPWKFVLDPRSPANRSKWLREDGQWKMRAYLEKPLLPGMAGLSTRPNRDERSAE